MTSMNCKQCQLLQFLLPFDEGCGHRKIDLVRKCLKNLFKNLSNNKTLYGTRYKVYIGL